MRTPFLNFSQHGYKSLREGTLGKQPPKKVGYFKSDEESVGVRRSAQKVGEDHIAGKSKDPRQHSAHADNETRAK